MTKKELRQLRLIGLDAAITKTYFSKKDKLTTAEKNEYERCTGVLRAIYYISPNEWDRIISFIKEHFSEKYAIYSGNLFRITATLKGDYYKQYKQ